MIIIHKRVTTIIACISHTDNLNKGQVIRRYRNYLLDDVCFNQLAKLYTILITSKLFAKIMEIFLQFTIFSMYYPQQ